jgi:hypothetical protein
VQSFALTKSNEFCAGFWAIRRFPKALVAMLATTGATLSHGYQVKLNQYVQFYRILPSISRLIPKTL